MVNDNENIPSLSVVIPVYREGSNLRFVLGEISGVLETLNQSYEVILVDDGSPDDTWAIITEEKNKYPMLRALRLSRNFGKEHALCAGLEWTRGKAVIVLDGDLQHPPALIPEMVRLWLEKRADVIEAVKYSRGSESFKNAVGAKVFYKLLNKLSGYDLEGASDYKLLDRRVVSAWLQMSERNLFFRGMTAWLGFRRVRIPFSVQDRVGGKSGWSLFRLVRLAINGVTAFSSFPLHIITLAGAIFSIFAVLLMGQTLYMKISGRAVSGFTTVILLLLIIGSLLMIGLGIIGEYIARIFEEVKRRPRYVIAEAIDGNGRDEHDHKTC